MIDCEFAHLTGGFTLARGNNMVVHMSGGRIESIAVLSGAGAFALNPPQRWTEEQDPSIEELQLEYDTLMSAALGTDLSGWPLRDNPEATA